MHRHVSFFFLFTTLSSPICIIGDTLSAGCAILASPQETRKSVRWKSKRCRATICMLRSFLKLARLSRMLADVLLSEIGARSSGRHSSSLSIVSPSDWIHIPFVGRRSNLAVLAQYYISPGRTSTTASVTPFPSVIFQATWHSFIDIHPLIGVLSKWLLLLLQTVLSHP